MKELSLHLLDIIMNSVRGEADTIKILVTELPSKNTLELVVEDNGKGIPEDMLKQIKDPFVTSRTSRKVGLGIALFNDTCKQCNGHLEIDSVLGQGTKVVATMDYENIDRPPMGDLGTTLINVFSSYDDIHFFYTHRVENETFKVSVDELKVLLDGVPLSTPEVYTWTQQYITENIMELYDKELTKNS